MKSYMIPRWTKLSYRKRKEVRQNKMMLTHINLMMTILEISDLHKLVNQKMFQKIMPKPSSFSSKDMKASQKRY